ncbi:hypothetical protein AB9P05_05995 [Roseivirga sp. BDSF3-8]|uniref:hypothetical protein n=1 Tax=Roseivirga sp. BDSF3-8 TaxID=3241598 RepID=UPI003531F35C
MNKVLRVLLLAIGLLLSHSVMLAVKNLLLDRAHIGDLLIGLYGLTIYLAYVGFWAYLLFSTIYQIVIQTGDSLRKKALIATILTIGGYAVAGYPDIAGGTFFNKDLNKDYWLIVPTIFVLIILDSLIRKKALK